MSPSRFPGGHTRTILHCNMRGSIPQCIGRGIEEVGELVSVGYGLENFGQEVGVVSAAGFEEELFWGGALGYMRIVLDCGKPSREGRRTSSAVPFGVDIAEVSLQCGVGEVGVRRK